MFVSGNSSLRKGAFIMAGAGVYGVTAYMTYIYLQPPPVAPMVGCGCGRATGDDDSSSQAAPPSSCVHSPLRIRQFEKVAHCYDTSIGRDEFFMGINLLRRSLLYFHAKGTCLEVGAGTARNIPYYPKGTRVVLTDQSEKMLEKAMEKIQKAGGNHNNKKDGQQRFAVVQGDSAHLDLPDQAFDSVIDTFGLCSYDDPVRVLKEMTRVCKSDGKILLLEHGRSKQWAWINAHLDKYAERHASLWGCVWNRDLDDLLQQVADELEVQILHKWHFGTTYYVVCRPRHSQPAKE